MGNGYIEVNFECESIEATTKHNALNGDTLVHIKCVHVKHEQIMDNLNFEDVMNYYGVVKVLEWAEANR